MTTKIKLKKSSVGGNNPDTSDLDHGELAINYADGRLWYKNSSNSIKSFADSDRVAASIQTTVNSIDSDYVQLRAVGLDYNRLSNLPSGGGGGLDSGEVVTAADARIDAKVDASFINALTIDADTLGGQNSAYHLAYGNFTGTPTIPTFGTDFVDSAATNTLIDARVTLSYGKNLGFLDSAEVVTAANAAIDGKVNKAYIQGFDFLDSSEVVTAANARIDAKVNATFINALTIDADTLGNQNSAYHLNYNNFTNKPTIMDSAEVVTAANAAIDAKVNGTYINNLTIDADTLGGQNSAYHLAYANFTGTPTIPTLGTDFVDSAQTNALIDARVTLSYGKSLGFLDSSEIVQAAKDAVNKSYIQSFDFLDSGEVVTAANARIDAKVDATFINALTIDADTLGGQNSAYHLNYNNFTNTPTIPTFGTDFVDSAATNTLIDSKVNATFINNLTIDADTLGGQNSAYHLAYGNFTGTPTIPTFGTDYVDSGYVTTEINAVIDAAPGALNTLNELAAALGDDANFSTTVTNQIGALPDSSQVSLIITADVDAAFIKNLDFLDSGEVVTAANAAIDSKVNGTFINNLTINADTATALETARNIGGVSFDGTANIDLPGVNTAGNQNTSGTAALATSVTATANNTTNETVYLTFVDGATGTQGIETDTGLSYNPNSGTITSTVFSGSGASLTNLPAGQLTGTIDSSRIPVLAAADITSGSFADARIPSLAASKITSGVFDSARVPIMSIGTGNVTSGTFADARIPNLATSKITSGTFDSARIPVMSIGAGNITSGTIDSARVPIMSIGAGNVTSGTFADARIPNLAASKITSGTFDSARIPVLSAADITSGTISDDRLPASISSDITGNAATVTATANNSTNETVYLTFVDGATGSQGIETDTGLTYNPSTGTITSTTFSGALSGNASTATSAATLTTARNIGGVSFDGSANIDLPGVNTAGNQNTSGTAAVATSITATANNSTNETVYLTFVDGSTGSQGIETDTGLTYNPNSGLITATAFAGDGSALTGLPTSGLDSALVMQLIDSDYVNLTAGVSTTRSNFVVGTSAGSYNGSTTDFPVTYTVGLVDVYLNGIKMVVGTDVTATNGTSVVLASAADIGMTVEVVAYQSFGVANVVAATGDAMTGNLTFGDNNKAIFGAGSDLQIWHDGSNSYIKDAGTGDLRLQAAHLYIQNTFGQNIIDAHEGGTVNLYYNTSKKFGTTNIGVDVTGTLDATGAITGPTTDTLLVINSSGTTVKTIRGV